MTNQFRRTLEGALALSPLAALPALGANAGAERAGTTNKDQGEKSMYGLIGKMKTHPGKRDALAAILLEATQAMPGCLSYVIANDPQDADALWITEIWASAEEHKASLGLPAIKAALLAGRPLIAGFGERFETHPVGGFGTRLSEAK